MQDPLQKIKDSFPGRKVEIEITTFDDDFMPRHRITVDGHKTVGTFSIESMHTLQRLHGSYIEKLITNIVVDEIARDTNLPLLSKWKQLKNQIDYLRKRKNWNGDYNP